MFQIKPIGRKKYLKRFLLIQLVFVATKLVIVLIGAAIDPDIFPAIAALIFVIGAAFYMTLNAFNNFSRACDVEGTRYISKIKWICLTFIPFIALYGHCVLFFKKGKPQ